MYMHINEIINLYIYLYINAGILCDVRRNIVGTFVFTSWALSLAEVCDDRFAATYPMKVS